jgi:alpha-L-arabinofuranosidase
LQITLRHRGLAVVIAFVLLSGTAAQHSQSQAGAEELLRNGGFEEGGSPAPARWTRDMAKTGKMGRVSQDQTRFHSGHASLKMEPNSKNNSLQPLSIVQLIPAGAYRGRRVKLSGYVIAEGGAMGVLGMLSIVGGRPANLVSTQPTGGTGWVLQETVYNVPDDPNVQLGAICMVGGQSGAVWFDDLSVVPYREEGAPTSLGAPMPSGRPTPASDKTLKATVEVDTASVIRQIPRTLYGTNIEWRWNANGLWLDSSSRSDPDLTRLARELGLSLIRYPGGALSDAYHWKNGIGPYVGRPEADHELGKGDKSRPNFGTDEALDFAKQVGAELLITVNAGSGTPQEAADWVRYVNGKGLRVRYWEIGNELYINDGSPMSKRTTLNPSAYAQRFLAFASAMRAADARIKIGAIGGENQGRYAVVNYGDWDRTVLQQVGDQTDFLSVHNAYAPVLSGDDKDLRTVYRAMLAAPTLVASNLNTVSDQVAKYAPGHASRISIAVTEWGPLLSFDPRSRYVDHVKTLGSALFAASTLKALIESPRTEIANFFLLNDLSVLGWIGSTDGRFPPHPAWAPTARYFAFQVYTHHFGEQLVWSKATGPTYDCDAVGLVDAVRGVPYLDIVSSLSSDGRKLYIIAINKHFDSAIEASIALRGFQPISSGTAWTLTGTGIDANTGTTPLKVPGLAWGKQTEDQQNPRFSKGGSGEVTLSPSDVTDLRMQFTYRFPPHSVTSLVLTREVSSREIP